MNHVLRTMIALLPLMLGSCASGPVPVDTMTNLIVMQPGGSLEWGFDDGGSWSLSLEGEDGLLRVDGATVHLVGVAPCDALEFRHNSGPEDWRLEFCGGGWVCTRDRIYAPKGEYALRPGMEISLDLMGNLLETTAP